MSGYGYVICGIDGNGNEQMCREWLPDPTEKAGEVVQAHAASILHNNSSSLLTAGQGANPSGADVFNQAVSMLEHLPPTEKIIATFGLAAIAYCTYRAYKAYKCASRPEQSAAHNGVSPKIP